MKHFDHCQCEKCRRQQPAPPALPHGFLMQQIVSQGRLQERCGRYCLALSPLPRLLMPPYTVKEVALCGDVSVKASDDCEAQALVTLPLAVLVCDQMGNSHRAQASLTLCVPMRIHPREQAASYLAQAQVMLCRPCNCFDDPAQAAVYLTVCVQVFGVCWQAMYAPPSCAPACPPPLPLYPQPCCH